MYFEYRRFGLRHEILIFDWGFITRWPLGVRVFPWDCIHVEHDSSKLRGTYIVVYHGNQRFILPVLMGLYEALHRGLQHDSMYLM